MEATKYTEVGYVGRDVESMIRDLMAVGYSMVKSEMQETLKTQAEKNTEEILLDLLLPGSNKKKRKTEDRPLLITNEAASRKIPEKLKRMPAARKKTADRTTAT